MNRSFTTQLPRYALFGLIAVILFSLLREWNTFSADYEAQRRQAAIDAAQVIDRNATALPVDNHDAALYVGEPLPAAGDDALPNLAFEPSSQESAVSTDLVKITTNTMKISIEPKGGRVVEVQLLKHLTSLGDDGEPLKLLEDNLLRKYTAFDAVSLGNDSDTLALNFVSDRDDLIVDSGDSQSLEMRATTAEGVVVTRRFTFDPESYVINSEIELQNQSGQNQEARYNAEIERDASEDPGTDAAPLGMRSYLGTATTNVDKPYKKISFKDIAKENYLETVTGGWVAMIQHYFVSAWIPDQSATHKFYTRHGNKRDPGMNRIGFIGNTQTLAPGETITFTASLYVGPKNQYTLGALAENLELTVDYGWLWWLAQPLYTLLNFFATGDFHIFDKVYHVFPGFNNWGVAIIALTFVVKAIFFKLSATSYRSMANMRRVQPKLLAIRERYASDKQAQSKAMMELYQKEKINPLGGCLPILIQMPVFIALYWALIESVELRHAPFALWIKDLSIMDPFYILPVLMGVTMYFQTKMNPTPPDPMQAKVMQWMPFIFTFFFLWFPAGLVIYWVTNNILSIAQQWYITRKIEKEAAAKA